MAVVRQTMVTSKQGILYTVHLDGEEKWNKYVRFSKRKTNRAGGVAFIEAAREQEKIAVKLLGEAS